ncbi:MAG: ornithine carbamoyltransferase [Bdellovibrionota bacterium]
MFKLTTPHFLTGEELSHEELMNLLHCAIYLKAHKRQKVLQDKTLALLFEKSSLRTRMSFTVGIEQLSGSVIEIISTQRKKETPADTIRVMQGYVDGLMIRTFEHEILEEMAKHSEIPIINGLSDLHHPCQALADLQTLLERFGKLQGMKLCYVGDGNNVLHSLLLLAPFVGVDVHFACPEGYQPDSKILARAKVRAQAGGAEIKEFKTPQEAVAGAHSIYTDVWTSMGQEEEQTERLNAFAGYQVNRELHSLADSKAIIMHCMPIHEDQEITREMIEHSCSVLFQQSENRLHAQKALLTGLYSFEEMRPWQQHPKQTPAQDCKPFVNF